MKTQFYLNTDVRAYYNSNKNSCQVIHVETLSESIYIIGAYFETKGEIDLGQGGKFFDQISISKLVLKNLYGSSKKIVDAEVKACNNNFAYKLIISIKDNPSNDPESEYTPIPQNPLALKRCRTDNSMDVTIDDANPKSKSNKRAMNVGPKICQFRIT